MVGVPSLCTVMCCGLVLILSGGTISSPVSFWISYNQNAHADGTGTLTVIKEITNDNGGTLLVEDVILAVDGAPVISGAANTFAAGLHNVAESFDTQRFGTYTATFGGDCLPDGTVTLGEGDTKTCTIINDDNPAELIVNKDIINDNGGTLQLADVTLTIDSSTNVNSGDLTEVNAGANTVTESFDTSTFGTYTATFGGDCNTEGSVSLLPGETKTCTITNDDIAPTITLIKNVINDNGGTNIASDFTLTVHNPNGTATDFTGSEDGVIVAINLSNGDGSYSVTESGPAGYSESDSADCSGQLTLADSKTCAITNDDIAITFSSPEGYNLSEGVIGSIQNNTITIDDGAANVDPLKTDKILATVTTSKNGVVRDSTDLELTETGPDTHLFTNINLIFMDGNNRFRLTDTATISVYDPDSSTNPNLIETSNTNDATSLLVGDGTATNDVAVISWTEWSLGGKAAPLLANHHGIDPFVLSEATADSPIFTGKLGFTNGGVSAGNALYAQLGDVITIFHTRTPSIASNGIIIPNPYPGVGALEARVGDDVKVTYKDTTMATTIRDTDVSPGSGGGGLARSPSVVVDAIIPPVAGVTGGGGDAGGTGPSVSQFSVNTANQEGFAAILELDPNKPHTNVVDTFDPSTVTMRLSHPEGASAVQHVGIYLNLGGIFKEVTDSDTYIVWDKNEELQVVDPQGFMRDVDLNPTVVGKNLQLRLHVTFVKEMPKSDVLVRTWDADLNTRNIRYKDAIQIVPPQTISPESKVPVFVKNNAKFWADGQITDDDFTKGIQYLIQQNIMIVPTPTVSTTPTPSVAGTPSPIISGTTTAPGIPAWIKNNAKWWAEDQISESDFLSGIQYLIAHGILVM